jgi:hypothetical protein
MGDAANEARKAPKPVKTEHDSRPIGGVGGNSSRTRSGGKPGFPQGDKTKPK